MRTYEQTESEALQPLGMILENKSSFYSKAKMKFNPYLKVYEYDGEELDTSRLFSDSHKINGTWVRHLINSNQCRNCEKEITPYKEIFFKKYRENEGTWTSTIFCMRNNYCKTCAINLTKLVREAEQLPKLVKDEEREIYGELIRVQTFSDGSVIEEMTQEELHKDPYVRGNK